MSSRNQNFLLDFLTNSDKISIRTSLQEWGNEMKYDKELIAGKLRRWEKYMDEYRLPDWVMKTEVLLNNYDDLSSENGVVTFRPYQAVVFTE